MPQTTMVPHSRWGSQPGAYVKGVRHRDGYGAGMRRA